MKCFVIQLIVLLGIHCVGSAQNQDDYASTVQALHTITEMPYLPEYGGDEAYWNCVQQGIAIVPALIAHLDDSTATKAPVALFGGNFTVGDICFHAIMDIIHDIPTLNLIKNNWPEYEEDTAFWNYWLYVRSGNRGTFKQLIAKWYAEHKGLLVWQPVRNKNGAERETLYPVNQSRQHPAGGFYVLSTNN